MRQLGSKMSLARCFSTTTRESESGTNCVVEGIKEEVSTLRDQAIITDVYVNQYAKFLSAKTNRSNAGLKSGQKGKSLIDTSATDEKELGKFDTIVQDRQNEIMQESLSVS
jgi:hypothetical protein